MANGLVYVDSAMPGISRYLRDAHFHFKTPRGEWIKDPDEIARIRALAIPPAYTDVWICPLANGHLQAVGLDARRRKQYRYHPDWRTLKDESKFEHMQEFGRALPRIRARVARDLAEAAKKAANAPTREQVLAAIVRLLDTTYLRVGNEQYASSNRSFGLTTLRRKHADVKGSALKLHFRGKSGVMHEASVDDVQVVRIVRRCQQLPGQELFQYQDSEGARHAISSSDVNDYLHEAAGGSDTTRFTAKDFRTWHGTVQALELTRLACTENDGDTRDAEGTQAQRYSAREILGAVARQLGNTPAVCKKAYVHPAVLALGTQLTGEAEELKAIWRRLADGKPSSRRLHAAEGRLIDFLRHQQRRRQRRATAASGGDQSAASGRKTPSASKRTS
ncbi:MAG: DNA topoisomerase IB [Variovorax sp.]